MKKVVILSAFATPFRSGAEACAEEVAAQLKDKYDITIVTSRMRKNLPYMDTLESGVKVWRVGLGYRFDKWLYPFLAPRAAKALKPDIVHAVLETFAGLALKRYRGTGSKILTCQTTNRTFLKKPIIKSADIVTAISSPLVLIANDCGKDAHLIPNGIRLQELKAAKKNHAKNHQRVLFVGRLEPMKGIDTLLRAFAKVPKATLRIVGDGSERSRLEMMTIELGIADRVTFIGRVPPARVAVECAEAGIFCGLSRSEALGNVFLEAQAAGCAVIATRVGGIPDIVSHKETGFLIEPNNVEAAADALRHLLTDESFRQRLADAGQKHAEGYDWPVIAQKYEQIWTSA